MNKQDMIDTLYRKIVNNRNEAEHYARLCVEQPESIVQWKELQGWYEGRVSAYQNAKRMLEECLSQ